MAKVTKREHFEGILTILNGEIVKGEDVRDLVDFVCHEIDLLDRKRNTSPNPKREAEKNAAKHEILNAIAGGFYRASEIAIYGNMSVQKATALLRQLVLAGEVRREIEGKVTKFYLV